MGKVNFIFGIHNHQPVGNFGSVFEQAYFRSYLPLVEVLEKHPKINWNLHVSGVLWDWIVKYKPEYVKKVKNMVDQGRLELLTGGYYEPVLSSLSDVDKMGQIKKLSDFLGENFGVDPKGLWLTERVWEPHLPKVLAQSGIDYTVIDDTHFHSAGMLPEKINGYYATEEQGFVLKLFPIHKILRYMIPFSSPDDCLHYFQSYAEKNDQGLLVMADDGEKFGLWPGTFEHVYKNGWLERFFTLLENHDDWIKTWRFSDFSKKFPSKGVVYIPSSSYFEMSEWTLPADMGIKFKHLIEHIKQNFGADHNLAFLRGANWRNFMYKYAESNNMHKKMLYISRKVHNTIATVKDRDFAKKVLDKLWAGQCNCAYWHGVFGGLYLPHLREAIYNNLLQAEQLCDSKDEKLKRKDCCHVVTDYNGDGMDEIIIESKTDNFYFLPHMGGAVVEWDYKPALSNLTNVLARREESYHEKLKKLSLVSSPGSVDQSGAKTIHDLIRTKQDGLEDYLFYDWHQRLNFLDHFFHPATTIEDFRKSQYGEQGDFILARYSWRIHEEKTKNVTLKLFCQGNVWVENEHCPLLLNKEFEFPRGGGVGVSYTLTNLSLKKIDIWFGVEHNLLLNGRYDNIEELNGKSFSWLNMPETAAVKFDFKDAVHMWKFPIETVSQSEDGFEKTFQGVTIVPHKKISIDIASSYTFRWKISVSKPANANANY